MHKYIQRFNNVRLKIPKVSDEATVSAFTDGIRDVKMKEDLAIHEDLCTALEMFNMATKYARAEERRLSLLELPEADPKDKKTKAKDVKHKGPAVLVAEPEMKRGCDHPESSKRSRPFCVFQPCISTTPMTARSSGPSATDASVVAPSATTEATALEEDEADDAGTTATPARTGATSLVRTAGKASLARAPGGISVARTVDMSPTYL